MAVGRLERLARLGLRTSSGSTMLTTVFPASVEM